MKIEELRKWRTIAAYDALYAPAPPPVICPGKDELHDYAAEHIGRDAAVNYYEFGVAFGQTFGKFVNRFTSPQARFVGFDSFEGLPSDWYHFKAGHFSNRGREPKIADARVSFQKGYFQNTVLPYFSGPDLRTDASSTLANYDADIYGSTMHVMAIMWQYVPEFYFLMDEFWFEDAIVLHDFCQAFPVKLELLAATLDSKGFRPSRVFGKLTRQAFTLPPKPAPAAEPDGV